MQSLSEEYLLYTIEIQNKTRAITATAAATITPKVIVGKNPKKNKTPAMPPKRMLKKTPIILLSQEQEFRLQLVIKSPPYYILCKNGFRGTRKGKVFWKI